MQLSEAIRLGALLKPQGLRGFFDGVRTCALGAAADAIGRLHDLMMGRFQEAARWPILSMTVDHPITQWPRSVWDCITSLNDMHEWSREQIADWVATIESAQTSAESGSAVLVDRHPMKHEKDQNDHARGDTPTVITDDSRTASEDTVLSPSVSPDQIHNAMKAHAESGRTTVAERVESLTRLTYWFPLIAAAGLPVPVTRFVYLTPSEAEELISLFDGETPSCFARLVSEIRAAAAEFGVPFFLRTDFTSGKHSWVDTCFVKNPERISHHVASLVEFSEIADMFGGMPADVFVVREFLKTTPAFVAFHGMPITREFRFFVRDDVIEHWQPYWPAGAFENCEPNDSRWREKLADLSALPESEHDDLVQLTRQASAAVPGFWSVDWLFVSDRGWVLTDMAEGDKSYRWEP